MSEKVCSKCKISKRLEDFYKNCDSIDGYATHCKECKRKYRPKPKYPKRYCKVCGDLIIKEEGKKIRKIFCSDECYSINKSTNKEYIEWKRLYDKEYREIHKNRIIKEKKEYYESDRGQYLSKLNSIRSFGIDEEEYVSLLDSQKGCCGVCKEELDIPHVDHNHNTGEVRGLLCMGCNTGLGLLKDSPFVITNALEYLKKRGCYGLTKEQALSTLS